MVSHFVPFMMVYDRVILMLLQKCLHDVLIRIHFSNLIISLLSTVRMYVLKVVLERYGDNILKGVLMLAPERPSNVLR